MIEKKVENPETIMDVQRPFRVLGNQIDEFIASVAAD